MIGRTQAEKRDGTRIPSMEEEGNGQIGRQTESAREGACDARS